MKKRIIVFIFGLFFSQNMFPQSGYTLHIEKEEECVPFFVIATDDNMAIAVINTYPKNDSRKAELIKIDEQGNIIKSLVFPFFGDTSYVIVNIERSFIQGRYVGLGLKWKIEEERHLFILEFDGDLNIYWDQPIDTFAELPIYMQLRGWNNNYFATASFGLMEAPSILYKLGENGNVLQKSIKSNDKLTYYMRNIPNSSLFLMGSFPNDFETWVMDEEFNHISTIQHTVYPNNNPNIRTPLDLEFFNDTQFIRLGKIGYRDTFWDLLAVKKMDTTSRNYVQIRRFGYEGIGEWTLGCQPGEYKSLTMQQDYFFAGGYGFRSYAPTVYPEIDNAIMLYAFDYDLDSLWAMNYGSDAYYQLYYVSSTSDGGCLLAASRYDWRQHHQKRTAVIMKVPKPDITAVEQVEKDSFSVYPNPGDDRLFLKTETEQFTFHLFDMQGRLLLERQNEKEISTAGLPSGMYLYKIIDRQGKMSTGKWVKR